LLTRMPTVPKRTVHTGGHHGLNRFSVGDITQGRFDLAHHGFDPLKGFDHRVGFEINGKDFCAFLCKPHASRTTVASALTNTARAGDECDFSYETTSHQIFSLKP